MSKQKLNMTIGRFQPFTQGHLNMVNEGDGPCIIYRINSSDKKIERKKKGIKIGSKSYTDESVNKVIEYIDNPTGDLTEQEKELLKRPFTNELIDKELEIVKKSNKNIIDVIPVVNMFEALARFNKFILDHQDEYEPQYWMCGDDRVDNYSELIDKYDKLAIERGGEEYDNVVKGKLKTSTGKGRTEGVSGTAVRKAILTKDKSAFEKIMPKGTGSMFNDFIKAFDDFKIQLQNIIKEHKMMTLKEYICESLNTNLCYGIEYAANEQDILSFKYQTSLKGAQNFVRKMQTQGMLISCIYEVTSNNWDEFKKLSRSRNMDRDKLKELSNEYFRKKEDINKFLDKK